MEGTILLMIPIIIGLKVSGAEPTQMILIPLVLYVVFAPVITHYAKILWLHLENRVSREWEKKDPRR